MTEAEEDKIQGLFALVYESAPGWQAEEDPPDHFVVKEPRDGHLHALAQWGIFNRHREFKECQYSLPESWLQKEPEEIRAILAKQQANYETRRAAYEVAVKEARIAYKEQLKASRREYRLQEALEEIEEILAERSLGEEEEHRELRQQLQAWLVPAAHAAWQARDKSSVLKAKALSFCSKSASPYGVYSLEDTVPHLRPPEGSWWR